MSCTCKTIGYLARSILSIRNVRYSISMNVCWTPITFLKLIINPHAFKSKASTSSMQINLSGYQLSTHCYTCIYSKQQSNCAAIIALSSLHMDERLHYIACYSQVKTCCRTVCLSTPFYQDGEKIKK